MMTARRRGPSPDTVNKTKVCPRCGLTKSWDDFYSSDRGNGMRPKGYCKPCHNERNVERRRRFPDEHKDSLLRRLYNMPIEEYRERLALQNGLCAICNQSETQIDPRTDLPYCLSVDHDHGTGINRGLLCAACNKALGGFKDNPRLLHAAADYVEAWKGE